MRSRSPSGSVAFSVTRGCRYHPLTALGDSVGEAQAAAYRAVDAIAFPDGFFRRDIGHREIEREVARERA